MRFRAKGRMIYGARFKGAYRPRRAVIDGAGTPGWIAKMRAGAKSILPGNAGAGSPGSTATHGRGGISQ